MATISIEFGKPNKDGQRKVNFLLRQGTTRKRIPTDIYVEENDLAKNGKIKNPITARKVELFRRKIDDRLTNLTMGMIEKEDATYYAERIVAKNDIADFFEFAEEWIEKTEVKGKKNYKIVVNSLKAYAHSTYLPFERINYNFLEGYERYLQGKPRAQSLYIGLLRHMFREAMRKYNTDYEQPIKYDPFTRYRAPKQVLKKGVRALTLEELLKIYEFKGEGRAQLARDCFILSFCLMGINSVDMYECKKLKGEYLCYSRAKTRDRRSDAAYIEVRIHPIIYPLMKKWRGTSRVFNFYQRYCNPAELNRGINKGLKEVGKEVGIDNLQFYQARHTFATLSRNLMHFSKSDVDEALNHIGSFDIADVYIRKDFQIINQNNENLLNTVFKDFL